MRDVLFSHDIDVIPSSPIFNFLMNFHSIYTDVYDPCSVKFCSCVWHQVRVKVHFFLISISH